MSNYILQGGLENLLLREDIFMKYLGYTLFIEKLDKMWRTSILSYVNLKIILLEVF